MKILLVALPRTGSKFVHENINRYLESFGPTSQLASSSGRYLWYEPASIGHGHFAELNDTKDIIYTSDLQCDSKLKFYTNRAEIVERIDQHLVAKLHPNDGINKNEMVFINKFDLVILLKRWNLFDMLLSNVISINTDCWYQSEAQLQFINGSKSINIDLDVWTSLVKSAKLNKDMHIPGALEIFHEDMIKISSSAQFCQKLELPVRDFPFCDTTDEFSNSKYSLVSNLDELRQIFDDIMLSKIEKNEVAGPGFTMVLTRPNKDVDFFSVFNPSYKAYLHALHSVSRSKTENISDDGLVYTVSIGFPDLISEEKYNLIGAKYASEIASEECRRLQDGITTNIVKNN